MVWAIAGGQKTDLLTHPWQLRIKGCGAVLIGPRHVVTAGHCLSQINRKTMKILGGGTGNRKDLTPLPKVRAVHVHPDYQGWEGVISRIKRADIAIVELEEDVVFSDTLRPANLPFPPYDLSKVLTDQNKDIVISGWGRSDFAREDLSQLKEGESINLLPQSHHEFWDSNISLLLLDSPKYTISETFKTGHYLVAKAAFSQPCSGDSGGPMVDMKSKTLLGVSAHHEGKACGANRYFFYTSLVYFQDWIQTFL